MPKHCSEKKRSVVGPAYAEVIATRRGEIRYTAPDARRWLKWLFPRPARKGLLPRKICRWLAEETGAACSKSLQEVRPGVVLFVRRRSPNPPDSVNLLLELVREKAGWTRRRHGRLTRRENEVMKWVVEGKTNWEIAVILKLAEGTVGKHLQSIFPKLGVVNRAAAAAAFVRQSAE